MARIRQLLGRKSLEGLIQEMEGENRLHRVLGPVALSSLGIGAIIGTGIFVLTGLAARNEAGPGLVLSFLIAGAACGFAALCYAEFAAMAPVAGSAYTYAYTTLGELVAWIIGWDLVLEYAMGSATVANGWSNYFFKFLGLFKTQTGQMLFTLPGWLTMDPVSMAEQYRDFQTANALVVTSATATAPDGQQVALPVSEESGIVRVTKVKPIFTSDSRENVVAMHGHEAAASLDRVEKAFAANLQYEPTRPLDDMLNTVRGSNAKGHEAYLTTPLVIAGYHLGFNIVAIAIVAIVTVVLVIGIRESARFNATMVLIKVGAVLFVIFAGIGYVDTANWSPFLPYGWSGVLTAAGIIFFAYIGFDSISTHAEEARNPQRDVPIGILTSLGICTLLYVAVALVVTGMIPYPQIPLDAPIAGVFQKKGLQAASIIITIGALTGITSVLLVMLLSQPRVLLAMARDGLLPPGFFGAVHPRFRTPHKSTILTGIVAAATGSLFPLEALGHMVSIGTLFAFVVVCAAVWIMRFTHPNAPRPFRVASMNLVAPLGIILCLSMMVSLGWINWVRLFGWMAIGLVIYFTYGMHHSHLGHELRREIATHGVYGAETGNVEPDSTA